MTEDMAYPVHIKTVYGGAGEMTQGKVLGQARGPRFRPQDPGRIPGACRTASEEEFRVSERACLKR